MHYFSPPQNSLFLRLCMCVRVSIRVCIYTHTSLAHKCIVTLHTCSPAEVLWTQKFLSITSACKRALRKDLFKTKINHFYVKYRPKSFQWKETQPRFITRASATDGDNIFNLRIVKTFYNIFCEFFCIFTGIPNVSGLFCFDWCNMMCNPYEIANEVAERDCEVESWMSFYFRCTVSRVRCWSLKIYYNTENGFNFCPFLGIEHRNDVCNF